LVESRDLPDKAHLSKDMGRRETMKILLADDHDLVRDSLVTLITAYAPGAEVTGVNTLDAALGMLRRGNRYDIAILDLQMPGMNGLEGLEKVIASSPNLPVVLMSGAASERDIEKAMSLGAKGYLPKTMAGKVLVRAIELILAGEVYLPSTALRHAPGAILSERPSELTEGECQVLRQLKEGLANKEIAQRLGIHVASVKLHLRSLSKKLEVRNRTELVLKAIERGLP
jgi:two-component system, NarL family, nitrate/nitrite response regulator NarL